jgi:hypothetical protein
MNRVVRANDDQAPQLVRWISLDSRLLATCLASQVLEALCASHNSDCQLLPATASNLDSEDLGLVLWCPASPEELQLQCQRLRNQRSIRTGAFHLAYCHWELAPRSNLLLESGAGFVALDLLQLAMTLNILFPKLKRAENRHPLTVGLLDQLSWPESESRFG